MKIIFRLILLWGIFFSLFLLVTIPAERIINELKIDPKFEYGSVSGPWWEFEFDWLEYQSVSLNNVKVKLQFNCLISLETCAEISTGNHLLNLHYSLSDGTLYLKNSKLDADLEDYNSLMKKLLIKPKGKILLAISELSWHQKNLKSLNATAYWSDVGVQGEDLNLGQLNAKIILKEQNIQINLNDGFEALDLTGEISIASSGRANINIQTKLNNQTPDNVRVLIENGMKKIGIDQYGYQSKQNIRALKRSGISY